MRFQSSAVVYYAPFEIDIFIKIQQNYILSALEVLTFYIKTTFEYVKYFKTRVCSVIAR